MLYFKKQNFDCSGLRGLETEFLEFRTSFVNEFWNPLDLHKLKSSKYSPFFVELENVYGDINEVSLLYLGRNHPTSLHTDHTIGPNRFVKARLNIPLSGGKNSITHFYKFPEEIMRAPTFVNMGGTRCWDPSIAEKYPPVSSVTVDSPTILRTSEPHQVISWEPVCRISLTISFKEDLVRFLDN